MPNSKMKSAGRGDKGFTSLPPIDLGFQHKAEAVVGSLVNVEHVPGGGNKPIPRKQVKWDATANVGSLDSIHYRELPRSRTSQSDPVSKRRRVSSMLEASARYGALAQCGALGLSPYGEQMIARYRRYQNVRPRVGSLENIAHVPGGGEVPMKHHRTRWKADAKIGSLDNVYHVPGGGDVVVDHQRLSWQAKPRVGSLDNISHVPRVNPVKIPTNKTSWTGRARVGSLENIHHQPGGGLVTVPKKRLRWNAQAKVDSNAPTRRTSLGSSLESLNSH